MVKHLQKLRALVLVGLCLFVSNKVSGQAQAVTYPYVQNFNNCTDGSSTVAGAWTRVSTTGDATWKCTSYGLNSTGAVEMNGYDSNARGSVPNEDWLISPAFDLTDLPKPQFSFWSASRYQGPALKLMVSTAYTGDGIIDPANWTELAADFPAVNSDAWEQTKVLLSEYQEEATVHLAFVYTSGSGSNAASRWIVDDVAVTDVSRLLTTHNTDLDFGDIAVGAASASREFTFTAEGYAQEVVLTAPEGFELSKDNATFSRTLTYTAAEAAAANTVYARFAPDTEAVAVTGPVTFTSGTVLNEQRGMLRGSSILRENTLDIATWNMEWFGSTGNGPSDEALQYANAKKVIADLKADIIGVQEVSDDATLRRLAEELGYAVEHMPMPWQSYDNYQQVYFLYRPEVVTVKKEKVLLAKLYEDIKAGRITLTDYPNNNSATFWASGRLPYLVQFEASINGVKQTLNVVNIHAKANSGEDIEQYNRRKYDLQVLKDSLDAYYGNTNLVLLGDYNDDIDMSVVGTDNPSSYEAFVSSEAYKALTYELSVADAFSYASGSLRSFLDHIIITEPLVDNYLEGSVQVEAQFVNSIEDYRNTTSDHVPVSARFRLQASPTVTFAEATATKGEAAGEFDVMLTLSGAQEAAQSIKVGLVSGATATAADYTIAGMEDGHVTLMIPAGETEASFRVTVLDDAEVESFEDVTFRISSTSAALEAGAQPTYRLVIEDNDNTTTGIADATKGQFRVYPNPAESYVQLLLPERVGKQQSLSLVTYATDGKKLLELDGPQEHVQEVLNSEVKRFKTGLYLLKVVAGKEVFLTRLVKR
ncbi:putative secreted protein (Por secretion system target) [Pontibacter ummariensis]|uniref:Por secretion system C-terminal sorting domain-containing protein n=1 Tax=Pontibacter ummariensis TaxID=1610492 RepID=A0A239G7M3_9BACT|nr:choice-of-anchor J domain-containing protein [Pontibacter ummariensis]PRY11601.1 putative secreted protein (Por secretion system target) [Pontibacter ummariensis]SNS65157.1 Por secretion system C-terminal sorting domain-containing protein [Pontibacter ummariensis]